MSHTAFALIILLRGLLLLNLIFFPICAKAQASQFLASEGFSDQLRGAQLLRVVSYNVENLFDYFEDSLTQDDEFLPHQGRYWNKAKYHKKTQQIAQVIMALGGWEAPGLVGLCEIENRYVLQTLTQFTQLKTVGYEIIHKDSPDPRGIDVALLYRPDKFELVDYDFIEINYPFDQASKTRDILYAKGILHNSDTLHVFMNHWPSKYGGEFETANKRKFVAQQLKRKMDEILSQHKDASLIAMGDFNDTPSSESMSYLSESETYVNVLSDAEYHYGTHSFANEWSVIDQFVLSARLLDQSSRTSLMANSIKIFNADFLLTEGALGNERPFRTYQGPAYLGGFSDHLPIVLDLIIK